MHPLGGTLCGRAIAACSVSFSDGSPLRREPWGTMTRLPAIAALLMLCSPALAAEAPAPVLTPAEEAGRTLNIAVFGDDPCPTADDGTIIVCARLPERDRFRIPKPLRASAKPSTGPGWGAQVATIDSVSRQILPNSCSSVGSGGFTGCTAAMIAQWYAERRMSGKLAPLWRP